MSIASSARRFSISRAHAVGPGLGAEHAEAQRARARVQALLLHLVGDRQHVGRRDHDDVGLEILDQLHLALGLAARHRDHRAAQPLGAVMRPEPAGEQAVAVGDVDLVPRPPAGGANRARHHMGPDVDVVLRIAHHGRLAGGAATRRGCAPPGPSAPRTCRTGSWSRKSSLLVKGNLWSRAGVQIVRMHRQRLEGAAVMIDVVVGVAQRRLQARELQRGDLVAAGDLDRVEQRGALGQELHFPSSCCICRRPSCPDRRALR